MSSIEAIIQGGSETAIDRALGLVEQDNPSYLPTPRRFNAN